MDEWVNYVICSVHHSSSQMSPQFRDWNGPAAASRSTTRPPQYPRPSQWLCKGQVPKVLAARVVRLRCFGDPPTTSSGVTSKVSSSICSCSLTTIAMLSNSISSSPSAPPQALSVGKHVCLWFSRELDCISQTCLLRKRPALLWFPESYRPETYSSKSGRGPRS